MSSFNSPTKYKDENQFRVNKVSDKNVDSNNSNVKAIKLTLTEAKKSNFRNKSSKSVNEQTNINNIVIDSGPKKRMMGSNLSILDTLSKNFNLSAVSYKETNDPIQINVTSNFLNEENILNRETEKGLLDPVDNETDVLQNEDLQNEDLSSRGLSDDCKSNSHYSRNSKLLKTSNKSINTKSLDSSISSKKSKKEEEEKNDINIIENIKNKKQRSERAIKLWAKTKNIIKGIFNFQKMSKNLQLFGASEEQFDKNNPEVYLNKLKKIQTNGDTQLKEADSHDKPKKSRCPMIDVPVFHPDSKIMNTWNFIVFVLMTYTAIIMPYRVSFVDEDSLGWVFIENIIDIVFFGDVLFTLNLGYYDDDNVYITSRKKIFINYAKFWLTIDLVASFPQNLVLNPDNSDQNVTKNSEIFRLARLARLYRLIRIFRLLKIAKFFRKVAFIQRIQDFFSINYGISRLISFLCTTVIISHLMGCLWYIIPRIYDEQNNWVNKSGLQDEEPFRLYLFSIYWSFATIFTVGFGDIHAYNLIEYILSIFWMLFGVGFYSFTIGTLSSVLVNMDTRENILKGKLAILNDFCKATKLPANLKDKVKKILVYNSQKNVFSWIDKQEIFNELPANLKFEIAKSMRNGFLKDILFFTPKFDSFIAMIVPFLLPLNFQEKEIVYRKGDHPSAFYFLTQGRVHIVNDDFIAIRTLVKGCYFGEIDIIKKQRRAYTLIAGEICDCLTLSKQIYENVIVKEYPEIDNEIKTTAVIREKRFAEAEKELNEKFKKQNEEFLKDDTSSSDEEEVEEKNNSKEVETKYKKLEKVTSLKTKTNNNNYASSTYTTNIINTNQVSVNSKAILTENKEYSIIDEKKLSKNAKKISENSDSDSSYRSSDYFSNEADKNTKRKKVEINESVSVSNEHNSIGSSSSEEEDNNKSESSSSENSSELKGLKDELIKYTEQQKEIMSSINLLIDKFK